MKADFCVINPPFNGPDGQGMLHYDFLCRALEVAETVVSIQPATWMNQQKNRAGLPLNGRGAEITMLNDMEHLFQGGARMKGSVSVSVFSRKKQGVLVDWGTGYRTKYDSIEAVNMIDRYPVIHEILNKGYNVFGNEKLSQHIYGNNGGECAAGNRIIRDGSVLNGKWVVQLAPLIPFADGHLNKWGLFAYGKTVNPIYQHDGNPDNLVGRCYCVFDTEHEARNCYAYLASDFVRAYVIAFKTNQHLATSAPHIPWPATFDTDPALWTNEAVSDRAGLIPTERSWLKEILPDCYNIRI